MFKQLLCVIGIFFILYGNSLQQNPTNKPDVTKTEMQQQNNTGTEEEPPQNMTKIEVHQQNVTESKSKQKLNKKKFSSGYRAGVVQYYPHISNVVPLNFEHTKKSNLDDYVVFIKKAAQGEKNLDMIVFPEYGLISYPSYFIPYFPRIRKVTDATAKEFKRNDNPSNYIKKLKTDRNLYLLRKHFEQMAVEIPYSRDIDLKVFCNNTRVDSGILKGLSCAALDSKIYIVVNIIEKEKCHFCFYKYNLYNTNIVFDRNGVLIARYRKFNTFNEPWLNKIPYVELSKFTTDFHVTFAQIIGTDIFEKRILNELKLHNEITDIVCSTHTLYKIPFFTSVHDFMYWAQKLSVNMLVSGFSHDGGPGIFLTNNKYLKGSPAKKSPFNAFWYSSVVRKNYTKPKNEIYTMAGELYYKGFKKMDDMRNFHNYLELYQVIKNKESLEDYFDIKSILINEDDTTFYGNVTIRYSFTCTFQINLKKFNKQQWSDYNIYKYRLMAMKGIFKLPDGTPIRIEMCLVMACTSNQLIDCGKEPLDHRSFVRREIEYLLVSRKYRNNIDFDAPIGFTENRALIHNLDYNYYRNLNGKDAIYTRRSFNDLDIFGLNFRIMSVGPVTHKSYLMEIVLCTFLIIIIGIIVIFCFIMNWSKMGNDNLKIFQPDRSIVDMSARISLQRHLEGIPLQELRFEDLRSRLRGSGSSSGSSGTHTRDFNRRNRNAPMEDEFHENLETSLLDSDPKPKIVKIRNFK